MSTEPKPERLMIAILLRPGFDSTKYHVLEPSMGGFAYIEVEEWQVGQYIEQCFDHFSPPDPIFFPDGSVRLGFLAEVRLTPDQSRLLGEIREQEALNR